MKGQGTVGPKSANSKKKNQNIPLDLEMGCMHEKRRRVFMVISTHVRMICTKEFPGNFGSTVDYFEVGEVAEFLC